MKRCILAVIFILVIGLVCMTLPMKLMQWQDEKRLDRIETEPANEVKLNINTQMTLEEKLELKDNDLASVVMMVNGKNYNQDNITSKIEEELIKLAESGLIDCEELKFKCLETVLRMYVDPNEGAKSTLMWSVYVSVGTVEILVLLDDESGKILNVEQLYSTDAYATDVYANEESISIKQDLSESDMVSMAKKWGDYLGLEFVSENSGSSKWVNEFLGLDLYEVKDQYIAVYKEQNDYLVYVLDNSKLNGLFSIEFYNK